MTELVRRELRAMNSDVILIACRPDANRRLDRAARWLAGYERRFSRFLATSELSRLNAAAGRPFRASPALFRLVQLALDLARRSNGLFDPTVLSDLVALGYDRSFELLGNSSPQRRGDAAPATWRDVSVEPGTRTITLPAGAGLDLGGIGKGWAVDRMAAILGTPCLADGGGDIFAAGAPPDGPAWWVGVADPLSPESDAFVLDVCDRGVATSSTLRRRWQSDGANLHHLIDPRTGRPSASDAVQATVIAANATLADYHAKVALLLGIEDGLAYLEHADGVDGVLFGHDGGHGESNGFSDYVSWRR
jgi:thiamine biosynthesis lipoprotein